jgi:C_GCAxxG_C_C family probable redox protein
MNTTNTHIDVETMRRNANKYFGQGRNCAQTTLLGLCSVAGSPMSEDDMLNITSGFGGGMGNTYDEGPCAALAAGVMFLGMHYGKSTRTMAMTRELYLDFKKNYGSPQCAGVIEKVREHECVGCCITVIDKIAEIMEKELEERAEA